MAAADTGDEVEETLQVSKAQAGQLAGPGGAGPARTVEMRTGAQVLVDRTSGGGATVTIKGAKATVKKALLMLKALVAFKEAASPEERGVCHWFACGFCRDGGKDEDEEGCEAGLHSSKIAAEIEAAWLAKAPKPALEGEAVKASGRPVLLALSCSGGAAMPVLPAGIPGTAVPPLGRTFAGGGIGCAEEDLLELSIVAVDPKTSSEVGRFHRFVRPVVWDRQDEDLRQKHPAACFADKPVAAPFTDVLADLLDWLPGMLGAELDDIKPEDVLLVSARDWEVQTLLPRRCNAPEHGTVDASLQDFFFSRWCCLKDVFRSHFALPNEAAPNSLRMMARHLGLPGTDQVKRSLCMDENTMLVRVTLELLKQGWEPKATAWRDAAAAQTQFLLPRRGDFPVEGLERVGGALPAKRNFAEMQGEGQAPFRKAAPPVPPVFAPPPGPPPGGLPATFPGKAAGAAPFGAHAKGVPSAPPAPWRQPQPLPSAPAATFEAVD
eukprot:gb/GFBE01075857.1/.p1 GENE.gb/GFBE01075857.1/~~gb/GFBE01075857.1/.p1  ORF type:complete len:494 (+),score=134.74 gb/GFBE01075857.1/:1-1482(+)